MPVPNAKDSEWLLECDHKMCLHYHGTMPQVWVVWARTGSEGGGGETKEHAMPFHLFVDYEKPGGVSDKCPFSRAHFSQICLFRTNESIAARGM
jgi:hypothetical protein